MIFANEKMKKRIAAAVLGAVLIFGQVQLPARADGTIYTVSVSSVNLRGSASTSGKKLTTIAKGKQVEVIGESGDWYKVNYGSKTGYIRSDMLTKGSSVSGSSATAKVTGSSVNIRKKASTSASVLKRVSKGTVLEAVSASDGWVKVKYDGVTGYVSADYVSVSGISVSDSVKDMDKDGKVNASGLNVRKSASTSASKLYSLDKGDKVSVTGSTGDWYRIKTSKGTGFVLAKYITIGDSDDSADDELTAVSASGKINASGVNVRKSASTSASKAGSLDKNDKVEIVGKQGDWYKIKTSKLSGFVLNKYVTVSSDDDSDKVEECSGVVTVTASSAYVRKSASTSASKVTTLDKGESVSVTGKTGSWYQVKTSKGTGYIRNDLVSLSVKQSSTVLKEGVKDSSDVKSMQKRLIELGYMSGSADGDFGAGTTEAVKAFQKQAGLDADGIAGESTISLLFSSNAPKYQKIVEASVSSYSTLKQGMNGDAVKKLQKRLIELDYLSGNADGDFGAKTTDAVKAFQKQAGLTADGVAGESTQKALFADNAPKKKTEADEIEDELDEIKGTLSMGDSGSDVKALQKRLIELGYMSGSADGDFGAKTRTAVMLFQKQAGLTADGKAGSATLKKLSSSSAEKYDGKTEVDEDDTSEKKNKVINSDWWKGEIQSVFTRGTVATITDVKTGISWKEKRRGGTNHADVEPLTSEDTAKLKKVYGGSWSWNRRAIWVTIGSKTYAASMNGMPHGSYSISNGFSGHHCIHFLNSRTHTGNRLDSDHQACVKYAYEQGNK